MSSYLIKEHPEFYDFLKKKNLLGIEQGEIQLLKVTEIHFYTRI